MNIPALDQGALEPNDPSQYKIQHNVTPYGTCTMQILGQKYLSNNIFILLPFWNLFGPFMRDQHFQTSIWNVPQNCVTPYIYIYIYIFVVVPIRAKLPCAYGHHHTGMGPHTHTVIFFGTLQVSLNIGSHISMFRI